MIDRLGRGRWLAAVKEHHEPGGSLPENWNEADLIFNFGSGPDALLYAELFAPEFIEIEGFVFLKSLGVRLRGGPDEIARQVREARTVSVQAVATLVASFSWLEIPYVFANPAGSEAVYEMLAALIAESWRGRLAYLFPRRRSAVRIIDPEESGGGVGVGFSVD